MVSFPSRGNALSSFFIYAAFMGGFALVCPAHADIWRCAQGYTNNPQGKTDCQPAGATESCGSDGNRYLAPRKEGEAPLKTPCKSGHSNKSPFVDMSEATGAKFGETKSMERLATVPSSSVEGKKKFSQSAESKQSNFKGLFSCSDPTGTLGGCSISDLSKFIEKTFLSMSDSLNR